MFSLVLAVFVSPLNSYINVNAIDKQIMVCFFKAVFTDTVGMPILNLVETYISNLA